jgi:crotonobetainyl-CoA:carnitine CoA-transferase CaiB-like acyl-CoA transferase
MGDGMAKSKLALEGIRIIDAGQFVAAPMAANLLSQWGAEVIHIEHPIKGDSLRGTPSATLQGSKSVTLNQHEINVTWEYLSTNKKSLTTDLSQKEGQEIIRRLVSKSDVFLSNMRLYEIEKFELQYEKLKKINPKIIYANLTGYGLKGDECNSPGYDSSAFFARSGITHMLSHPEQPPVLTRPALGDSPAGLICACGILVALVARERLGIGQEVHTSLFNSGVWTLGLDIQFALMFRKETEITGRESANNPLANTYKTKDGRWIRLAHIQPDPYWHQFCQAIEREDLEEDLRFNSLRNRSNNNLVLIKIIDEAFIKRNLGEWKIRLADYGLVFSVIQKPCEVIDDPQARANEFYSTFSHPTYGPIELVAAPIKLSETPGTFRTPAPEFGQHTEEILLELGYSWDEITELKDKRVI